MTADFHATEITTDVFSIYRGKQPCPTRKFFYIYSMYTEKAKFFTISIYSNLQNTAFYMPTLALCIYTYFYA